MDGQNLSGKVALVTGSTSGIGRGIALELAPYRIRVNAVAPGAVVSELTGIKTEEEQPAAGKGIPIQNGTAGRNRKSSLFSGLR